MMIFERWATAVVLLLAQTVCAAFQSVGHRHSRSRNVLYLRNHAESSSNQDPLSALETRLTNSPGYSSSTPISAADRSRLELAKVVVSTAVFLLSVQMKVKELTAKLKNDKDATSAVNGPALLPNGIQYTDMMSSSVAPAFPADGDEVVVVAKLFYNGLQVNKNTPAEALAFVCHRGSVVPADATSTWFEPVLMSAIDAGGRVPVTGIAAALSGMAYGTVRKAVLPSSLAFGATGLPPYVPPGASVLYELVMTRKV